MPKHINALFCLKKKRGQLELRTAPFTVSRYVRVVSLHAEPWPMNRDNRRHHTGCRTQSGTSKINFSYRLLMLCITVFCRFILRALMEAIQPCWLSFMVLYFVFVCGRLVTEREKQLLASKQYTNLIHEQKRIDAEIDSKVRVIDYGHQSNHACALFSGHISMIISESVVLVLV